MQTHPQNGALVPLPLAALLLPNQRAVFCSAGTLNLVSLQCTGMQHARCRRWVRLYIKQTWPKMDAHSRSSRSVKVVIFKPHERAPTSCSNCLQCTDKMGLRDLLPSNIYSNAGATSVVPAMPGSGAPIKERRAVAYSTAEAPAKKKIEMHSKDYYIACAIGGWLSCGLTHMAVTPLDVVKCNLQIDPKKYGSIGNGFSVVMKEGGVGGLFKGWLPTLIGYGFQGVCKFGFYEYFKKCVPSAGVDYLRCRVALYGCHS